MSKEDYVSLEVAKLLQEKGYPQEYNVGTLCRLQNKVNSLYERIREITQSDIDNAWCIFNEVYPTLYEAAKWLRIKHGVYVAIISSPITWLYKDNEGSRITHFPVITYRDAEGKTKMSYHQGMNDSEYEKAFNLAILEALKLI